MHENTLIAVIIGVLMALILLGCAGWYIAKHRVKRVFKEDRRLTQDTEKGLNSIPISRNNNRGWVRPRRKELIISTPNYVLITDGDGHRVRRGGRLAREIQKKSPNNGSERQQQPQKNHKQGQNQSNKDVQSKQNKRNKQHSKDQNKKGQNSEDKKSENKKGEDKKGEDKKSEDKKSEGKQKENKGDHKSSSQSHRSNQKVEKTDSWGVWESAIPAQSNDQKKSDSNKGNQENQDQSKGNEQNHWSFSNQENQDNHNQCQWEEQNQWNDETYGNQYNRGQNNWNQDQWNGNNENGQNEYYQNWGRRNDSDINKWNNELGPEDSISNQKRKANGDDHHRYGRRNHRSRRESANKSSPSERNGGHRTSRTGWSSKHKRGLTRNDQGKSKDNKPQLDRSKNYDNAMNSQVPMDDQKKNEGKVIPEKW